MENLKFFTSGPGSQSYDNVGALIRALHESGANFEQLRAPLDDTIRIRPEIVPNRRYSSPRSSLPSVTITCLDDENGSRRPSTPTSTIDESLSSHHHHNFHVLSQARRLSHFHFGLRRFSHSNTVRIIIV